MLPAPIWPLAEHASLGQNWFDASIGYVVLFCISTSWDRETKTAKMGHFILVCAWLGKVCCSPWTRARGACFTTLAPPDSLFLLVGTVTVVRKICLYS